MFRYNYFFTEYNFANAQNYKPQKLKSGSVDAGAPVLDHNLWPIINYKIISKKATPGSTKVSQHS
jgi:hypothetical protein